VFLHCWTVNITFVLLDAPALLLKRRKHCGSFHVCLSPLSADEFVLPSIGGRTNYSFDRVISEKDEQIFMKFGMEGMPLEPSPQ
jgi:hypothetical protein